MRATTASLVWCAFKIHECPTEPAFLLFFCFVSEPLPEHQFFFLSFSSLHPCVQPRVLSDRFQHVCEMCPADSSLLQSASDHELILCV